MVMGFPIPLAASSSRRKITSELQDKVVGYSHAYSRRRELHIDKDITLNAAPRS